jgi:hypothetical protein
MTIRSATGLAGAWVLCAGAALHCSSSGSSASPASESAKDGSIQAPGDDAAPGGDASTGPQGSQPDAGSGAEDGSTILVRPAADGGTLTPPVGCKADCSNKTCGDDGCNGTCGACPPSQLCGASSACQTPTKSGIVVDAQSQLTVISPAIYGVAVNSDDSMQIAGVNRWGGDSTGSYNWKNDIFNTGTDWNCANYQGLFTPPSPSKTFTSSADQFVNYNKSKTVDSLMTIPITGWLGNELTSSTSNSSCAGSTQDSNCCAEIGASESTLVDKGSAMLDTSYMGDWVAHLASTFGTAASGGVRYYQLDNEPDNWQALRKDIYPSLYPPGTFCESFYQTISQVGTSINQDFINRTIAYATAIKGADPTSTVLFMSMESPVDLVSLNDLECGNAGSTYTVDKSLTAAILALGAQHETSAHQRILDCVDMHYPVSGSGLTETQDLWDTSGSSVFPHIQGWINAAYPGTGICVSEYNLDKDGTDGSAPDPTTGTLEADLLGMYGRLGVRLAAYWTTLVHGSTHLPTYNAMAMYRNYDGQGGRFGSYAAGAASSNAGVNVYASVDSPTAPTTLSIMLVNVSGTDQSNLSIAIDNFTPGASAKVYRMTNGAPPAADTSATITGGAISGFSLPSGSVALLVVTK